MKTQPLNYRKTKKIHKNKRLYKNTNRQNKKTRGHLQQINKYRVLTFRYKEDSKSLKKGKQESTIRRINIRNHQSTVSISQQWPNSDTPPVSRGTITFA
jgi:hypothetical protein